MLYDHNNVLCEDQAFTATAVCTSTKKLGRAGLDIAVGSEPVGIRFVVKVAAKVSGGTETYELQAVSATAEDGTTGQSVLITTGTISTALAATRLQAGDVVDLIIPPGVIPATATHVTGKLVGANTPTITLDAIIAPVSSFDAWKPYPVAVTFVV